MKILCPLRSYTGTGGQRMGQCETGENRNEKCAWYIDEEWGCAIIAFPKALLYHPDTVLKISECLNLAEAVANNVPKPPEGEPHDMTTEAIRLELESEETEETEETDEAVVEDAPENAATDAMIEDGESEGDDAD